jgi:hypothetical protein
MKQHRAESAAGERKRNSGLKGVAVPSEGISLLNDAGLGIRQGLNHFQPILSQIIAYEPIAGCGEI